MKTTALSALSLLLLTACLKPESPLQPAPPDQQVSYENTGVAASPEHGLERLFAIGALSGTGGVKANGMATVRGFDDGTSVITVRLNTQPAPAGSSYMAQLDVKRADGGIDGLSLGGFTRPKNDTWHELQLETANIEQNASFEIRVIMQVENTVSPPGNTVATGVLKVVKR